MADGGLRGIIPTPTTLTGTLATVWTVPPGKEWTARKIVAANVTGAETLLTMTIGSGHVAYDTPIEAGVPANVFGPDSAVLPAGTVIAARDSAGGAVQVTGFFDERDV